MVAGNGLEPRRDPVGGWTPPASTGIHKSRARDLPHSRGLTTWMDFNGLQRFEARVERVESARMDDHDYGCCLRGCNKLCT